MRWLVVLIALSLAGCDCSHHDVENWSYACTVDGTCPDASTVIDSGERPDAGAPGGDGGADAGSLDAGEPDGAVVDGGATPDSSIDAGLADAGALDAGQADGGPNVPDAGTAAQWQCTMGWCWVHPRPFGTPSFV